MVYQAENASHGQATGRFLSLVNQRNLRCVRERLGVVTDDKSM
ncbi:hypothetical protein [Microcoleus sp. FACHB-68]|nr:hypothetical protein [Microcoleus sp. FACHB-68]